MKTRNREKRGEKAVIKGEGGEEVEDREIVQLYWDRDERAITESDGKYGPLCRSVALRILAVPEDSEECVSDTWFRTWNAIPPKRPDPLGPFLAKICRNLALDRWRRDHTAKRYAGETPLVLEELEEVVSGESLEDEVQRRELTRALNGFLESLSEGERDLFLRRYLAFETLENLAKQRGRSVSGIHKQLGKLREGLRNYLQKEGIDL